MKTVLYRIQSIEAPENEGFRYGSLRTLSKTKVDEEMCLRNEFGSHYLVNVPDYWICEILKEIEEDDDV